MSETFRVLISDSLSSKAAEVLSESTKIEVDVRAGLTASDIAAVIGDYHGLIVRSRTKVTADLIALASNLRIVGRAGIGVDNIDIAAASRAGIIVENAPSGNSVTTAEHAICLLLSLARNIPQGTASLKQGKWEKKKLAGHELFGKTFGVVGLGNIGRIVADRGRGLKMKVVAFDPFIGRETAARLGVELLSLDDLLARADFVSIHTPLTDDTRNLIDAAALAKAKDGLLLVNAARGGIVNEGALLAALESGKVAGAALDVFETEPPPADDPLVLHPNVICTPHLGASTGEAQEKVALEVAEQFVDFFERGEVRNAINMVALSAEQKQLMGPWLELSTKLGSLLGQLSESLPSQKIAIDELEIEVTGEPAEGGTTAITGAALVGLLRNFIDGPVNGVNAPVIAADRGLSVTESKRHHDRDRASAITIRAKRGATSQCVKGTVYHIGDKAVASVVQIDDYLIEADPRGHLLVVTNKDRPGVVGAIGTLLGKRDINVNSLHVGQKSDTGSAIAIWNTDDAIDGELLEEIRKLQLIEDAQTVHL